MEEDWRLSRGQEEYLNGVTLVRKKYQQWSETWDHDHCEFCWATFVDPEHSESQAKMVRDDPELQTEGYAVQDSGPQDEDDYLWICESCFNEFRERFDWRVLPGG